MFSGKEKSPLPPSRSSAIADHLSKPVGLAGHRSTHSPAQLKPTAPEEEKPAQFKQPVQLAAPLKEEEKPVQGKFAVQRVALPERETAPVQGRFTVQRKEPVSPSGENKTGMTDQLKSGLESMSGFDLSDVKVHYNSSQPAQLSALAYAQGNDIHIGPGQEKHLPHEAWHVVQQRQGRVQPTMQLKAGVPVNDDPGLEKEADQMGAAAAGDHSPIQRMMRVGRTVKNFFGQKSGSSTPSKSPPDDEKKDARPKPAEVEEKKVERVPRTVYWRLTAAANNGYADVRSAPVGGGVALADIGMVHTTGAHNLNSWYTNYYQSNEPGTKLGYALTYIVADAAVGSGAANIEISNANGGFAGSFAAPIGFGQDMNGGPSDLIGNAAVARAGAGGIAATHGWTLPPIGTVTPVSNGTFVLP